MVVASKWHEIFSLSFVAFPDRVANRIRKQLICSVAAATLEIEVELCHVVKGQLVATSFLFFLNPICLNMRGAPSFADQPPE